MIYPSSASPVYTTWPSMPTGNQSGAAKFSMGTITLWGDRVDGLRGGWSLTGVNGWHSPADADAGLVERTFARRVVAKPDHLQRKAFTVRGSFRGDSMPERWRAESLLAGLRGESGLIECRYILGSWNGIDEDTHRFAIPTRIDIPTASQYRPRFDFAIDFLADDPRRYGPWRYVDAAGATATVTNSGTAASPILIGGKRTQSQQTVTAPEGSTIFVRPFAAADAFEMNPADLTIRLNGRPSGGVKALTWPCIPRATELAPGSLTVSWGGLSSVRVGYRDAWW